MIPVESATAHGVIVANVPGVNAQTAAEYCATQFLLHGRRIARIDSMMRREGWAAARALADDVPEVHDKTVGIVGVGHIGARVATICHHGFGMRVLGYQRRLDRLPAIVEAAALDRFFTDSDFIALCCPLTPHLAGLSVEGMRRMSVIAAEDTLHILAGDKPVNFFNPEVWLAALRRRAALGAPSEARQ